MHFEVILSRAARVLFSSKWEGIRLLPQIMLNRYLVKRFITVEEVADLVAFLFGPSATSITGCNWIMDGGLTLQ
jgi:hypothetical protein